jgi:hypothetical protein
MKAIDTTVMTNLERAVFGANLINKLSLENVTKVLPQLESYIDKKICLANGTRAKIFEVELLKFSNDLGQTLRTYITFDFFGSVERVNLHQDVTVKNKNYDGGGYGVDYFRQDVSIGFMQGGVLTKVESLEQIIFSYGFKVEFCAKKVKETKDKIEQLKTELQNLESTIYQFKNTY